MATIGRLSLVIIDVYVVEAAKEVGLRVERVYGTKTVTTTPKPPAVRLSFKGGFETL